MKAGSTVGGRWYKFKEFCDCTLLTFVRRCYLANSPSILGVINVLLGCKDPITYRTIAKDVESLPTYAIF